jgi:hypothetical protein
MNEGSGAVLDGLSMLALGVHSQPGGYALLLGSGVSTGAGIPTGWGVVTSLVEKLAAAGSPEDSEAADAAAKDPEAWWHEHGDGKPLGYSNLLAAAAPTPAARQGVLATFFEPTDEQARDGLKVPSTAHRAIAELARRGDIRVIVTTNFDRLMERALEEAGIPPQVVSRPEAVDGMTPLQHARVTVIKLHGDYADLQMRNTVDELATYPPAWDGLLDRVFDEYGLCVSGWSADWDHALVAALTRARSRRYPLYWDERSSNGEPARRLFDAHQGVHLQAPSAEELFTSLVARLEALDRLIEAPLTTAMKVAQLKRHLLDPVRRIDVHDLVMGSTGPAYDAAKNLTYSPGGTYAEVDERLQQLLSATAPLMHLVATGVLHDTEGVHVGLWEDVVQRLLSARQAPSGTFNEAAWALAHYPALLTLRTAGLVAIAKGRDEVLVRLLSGPTWRNPFSGQDRLPAGVALHDYRVLDHDVLKQLPRWNGTQWLWPRSKLVRTDLQPTLSQVMPELADDSEWAVLVNQLEFRLAVYAQVTKDLPGAMRGPAPGEFIGNSQWTQDGRLVVEQHFRGAYAANPQPWDDLLEGQDLDTVLDEMTAQLSQVQRW